MPEGHSIRRLAMAFDEIFVGRVCTLSSPQGRFSAGAARLDGLVMTEAYSYGKHLFLGFDAQWIHVHLGLYGAWRFQGELPQLRSINLGHWAIGAPRRSESDEGITSVLDDGIPAPRDTVRLRIVADGRVADLTGPSRCEVLDEAGVAVVMARLGPDPLVNTDGMRERFIELVRRSSRSVGELVMDQGVSAGVGNIYRAEGLFRVGIGPLRPGSRIAAGRLGLLWDDFVVLMDRGVDEGRIRTMEPADVVVLDGDPEAERWYVYHRSGRPCLRCGAEVRTQDLKGRQLFWCPGCQR